MSNIIAIDPSYAVSGPGCACALIDGDGVATYAWYNRSHGPLYLPCTSCAYVVWECPEIRPREDCSPGKANTLIALAAEGAALAARYASETDARVVSATPHKWKGSVPKPIHHARLIEQLADSEIALVGGPSEVRKRIKAACEKGALARWKREGAYYYGSWTGHNLLDAIGIGKWARRL
jgi:hypothetical protein